ncbi:MAG: hypothetical protein ACM3TR_15535 [Caulobacteraceae bacterium]
MRILYKPECRICMLENYHRKKIPVVGGITFIPLLLLDLAVLIPIIPDVSEKNLLILFLVVCFGFLGIIDDLLGDKNIKGFWKHFISTVKGRMTTGFLKALAGFIAALIASYNISSTLMEFVLNLFIIALFANAINLLDLRPGRAVKAFLLVSVPLIIVNLNNLLQIVPLMILNAISWFYIPYDLKEVFMLGDTGSNILGIALGYYCALLLGTNIKLAILAVLVLLNVLSERISITEVIKNNKLLSYLDNIGRS